MTRDDRAVYDAALERARLAAYPPGEFVGQESFMRAGEILALASAAGIGPETSVLDLCCGVAGPGRFLTAELGCRYLGVDASPAAVAVARQRAVGLGCRFQVGQVPPLPSGRFDVVLLLETMLAFADKDALLTAVAAALPAGGRFAFTVEEGVPLTAAEHAAMPDADTVWLTPLAALRAQLSSAGLEVRREVDLSRQHLATVNALVEAFESDAPAITARIGDRALDRLLTGHRLWSSWLAAGRVRKFALVAERLPARPSGGEPQHDPAVAGADLH